MNINKNSWHYKLWVKSHDGALPQKTDLCRYAHTVFWALVRRALFVAALTMFAGMVVYVPYLIGSAIYHDPKVALIILGIIGGSVVLTALIVAIITMYDQWLNNDLDREPTTLLGKWLIAKKQKVCPFVEFTSHENDNGN